MTNKKQSDDPKIKVLLEYADSIIATLREPFLVLDKNLRVISANKAFYATFKATEKHTIDYLLPDLDNGQWNIPELLRLLKKIIPAKKIIKDYEVEHEFKQIGARTMRLNACILRVPEKIAGIIATRARKEEACDKGEELILLAIEDITERKLLQAELKESEERYRRAFETSRDGLLLVHKTKADILNSNESAQELLGYSKKEFLKKKLWEIGVVKSDKDFQETVARLEKDGVVHYEETPVRTKKGLNINTEVILVNKAKVIQCNIRDITERKRAESELAQVKDQQFRTLIENIPGKVFLKDVNSVYISCNGSYAKDIRVSPEEVAGKTDYDFFPTYLAEKYRADDKRIMRSGKIENIEEEYIVIGDYINKSKKSVINTVKIPVLDQTGNVTGLFGLFWDITERKKAEEEIRNLNKQLEFILGATNTGLDIIDSDFNMVYINPEWQKIYGDPSGKKCYRYFMGRNEECPGCGVKKALATKHIVVTEETLAKEGNRPIQVTTIPFQDKNGRWLVAEINVDITERKRTDEELKKYRDHLEELVKEKTEEIEESEKRFRTLFNDSRDGILLADIKTKNLIMCNRMICNMLGYTEEEVKRLNVNDIHPEKDLPQVVRAFERQACEESSTAEGLPVKRKDGSVFYADITSSLVTLSGKKYVMGNFRDITERKNTEKSLAEALKVKTDFTEMVSHELRTPLTAIKEGISIVLDKVTGDINEEQAKYLSVVKNNVDRLARLITAVLDFQKFESGKIEFKMEESDINEMVKKVESTMALLFKKKSLYFELELCSDLPPVKFDRDKIIQVLTNLVNNSLKFTEKGGITISTAGVNNFIQVTVKDTGMGIKEEDMQKLFQEFTQLERKAGGTGLGLSICRKIIEAHGGKIWAESVFGKGTAFCFILPVKERRGMR